MLFDQTETDGVHIILAMLIVGLVFCGTIAIGQLVHHLNHRRQARRPRPY